MTTPKVYVCQKCRQETDPPKASRPWMVECKCGYVTDAVKAATLGLGRVVKPTMTPEQIAYYEKCAAEQGKITITKPEWSPAICDAMFAALDKRGFHMESSDLGVDDMKAVFEAIFDEPEPV